MSTTRHMQTQPEDTEIRVNSRAHSRLTRARRTGETLSDVILRLSDSTLEGLQRRGEQEIVTSDGRKLMISIDQEKCLGAMSCVTMAPLIFAYDDTTRGLWRKQHEPLGMHEVEEGEVGSEALALAAESCPYQAIRIRDASTGEEIFP
ncbi:MAG: ferredoxin [Nitrososphaerales archaeon]|nr:ferredoxin [Nitrososphaerales archaeon]